MRKISMVSMLCAFVFLIHIAATAAPIPSTIPAVQEWTTGTGTMVFSTTSRIVVNTADYSALLGDARTFAGDLGGLLGRSITIVNAASANAGDIFLRLGATDTTIGTEGYIMAIGTTIDISARTAAGVFYGTRTVLQMLKQSTTVNQGTIRDWPRGRWRGQMVDAGRKFYTVGWLQTLIRDLAYVKMNTFHFHLSDGLSTTNNGGFRLVSTTHPEITSATDRYTDAELQSLISLATKYHITIIPEFDFPGHVNWIYPTHHRNVLLASRVLGNQYWALDLSKDSSYNLVSDILNEFIPKFPGPFWHLGADEYMFINEYANFPQLTTWARARYGANAHANDCYRHFTNWANALVKSKGKTMWAWNDIMLGITGTSVGACTVATDISLDHWGALNWIGWGGTYPDAERNRGYYLMNCSWDIFYIITTNAKTTGDPTWVYNNWELYTFAGANLPAGDSHILGGKFPVWGDMPTAETEAQVFTSTFQLCRAVAQKVWGSPKIQTTAPNFQAMATSIGRTPVPMAVSIKNGFISPLRGSVKTESVQLFDLRGALKKTMTGKTFNAGYISRNTYRFQSLTAGPYLCRCKGNGFETTEKILLAQ